MEFSSSMGSSIGDSIESPSIGLSNKSVITDLSISKCLLESFANIYSSLLLCVSSACYLHSYLCKCKDIKPAY